MTPRAPTAPDGLAGLRAAAASAGLTVLSSAAWPAAGAGPQAGPGTGDAVPQLAGFIESSFSPLLAQVAGQALRGRPAGQPPGTVTAIVMVSALGDVTTAVAVAAAVDAGRRVSPLLFFQSVPNAVAGYLAAKWQLTGPVVCVTGTGAGLEVAALLLGDGDADEALVVRVDLAEGGSGDRAAAILVTGPDGQ